MSMMSLKGSIVVNDSELMLMALHTHTICHSSNILGCMHCFWLFTLWFNDKDASFFHFFSQDTEHTELTVLLFYQNPYAIFAHILQHCHDFQNNVAIFPSFVQAYTIMLLDQNPHQTVTPFGCIGLFNVIQMRQFYMFTTLENIATFLWKSW